MDASPHEQEHKESNQALGCDIYQYNGVIVDRHQQRHQEVLQLQLGLYVNGQFCR